MDKQGWTNIGIIVISFSMKTAIVYDRVNKWGGAERILLALHKLFPDAPLYTSVYNRNKAPWAEVFDVRTSFLQKLPLASSVHEFHAPLMPIAFESFSFDEFDLVISVTSEAAKGIITKPKTLHICYCLTPTRYLWSGYDHYFKNDLLRLLSKPVVSYLRSWDKIAAQRPDGYIAISKEVQGRIKKYYGRESTVIYPPLSVFSSRLSDKGQSVFGQPVPTNRQQTNQNLKTENREPITGYFLIVSRLVPYKRIDIAIRAFNKLKLPLKIVGIGSDENRLRSIAKPNIEFLGYLTEGELVRYYRGCRALVFPGKEDFGLTALEAQSFGKAVIAFRGGGALETIIEDKTGEFFYPQNDEALIKKIREFKSSKYNLIDCVKQAERFSYERFEREFMNIINTISNRKTQIAKPHL